jgi:hypothetical protein
MSGFVKGKQKFSRDELIDILKRNANVFKDDEVFAQYVIDLAAFLVEYRNHFARVKAEAPQTETGEIKRQWLSRTKDRDLELERVLRKHASLSGPDAQCKLCGAPTGGLMTCPHCGNMAI